MSENHPRDVPRCNFWTEYDLPFAYDVAIKVRLSGLTRDSDGTGHASDTVTHLHVKEPFTEGRLSRAADAYLCEKDRTSTPTAEKSDISKTENRSSHP